MEDFAGYASLTRLSKNPLSEKSSKKSPTGDSKMGSKSCQNATWSMKTRLFGCFRPTWAWSVFVKGLFRQFQRQVLAAGRTGKTPTYTRTIASKRTPPPQGEALSAAHNVGWLLLRKHP
jgi:hypothetical protein